MCYSIRKNLKGQEQPKKGGGNKKEISTANIILATGKGRTRTWYWSSSMNGQRDNGGKRGAERNKIVCGQIGMWDTTGKDMYL